MNQLVRFYEQGKKKNVSKIFVTFKLKAKNKSQQWLILWQDLPRLWVLMKMTLFAPLSKAWKRLSRLAPDACSCATSFFSATSTSSSSASSSSLLLPLLSWSCDHERRTLLLPCRYILSIKFLTVLSTGWQQNKNTWHRSSKMWQFSSWPIHVIDFLTDQ